MNTENLTLWNNNEKNLKVEKESKFRSRIKSN